jgi:membrane-bound lytic murein transglycosylase
MCSKPVKFNDPAYSWLDGIYTANDTGGAIKGNKIDMFMGDYGDMPGNCIAARYGVRKVSYTVLRENPMYVEDEVFVADKIAS